MESLQHFADTCTIASLFAFVGYFAVSLTHHAAQWQPALVAAPATPIAPPVAPAPKPAAISAPLWKRESIPAIAPVTVSPMPPTSDAETAQVGKSRRKRTTEPAPGIRELRAQCQELGLKGAGRWSKARCLAELAQAPANAPSVPLSVA
jgi:hypothetical protein